MALGLTGGAHVPEIPFKQVVGKVKPCPAQNGPSGVKVGVPPAVHSSLIFENVLVSSVAQF